MADGYQHDFNVGFNSGSFHSHRKHTVYIPAVLLNAEAFKEALKDRPNGTSAHIQWLEPIPQSKDDPLGESRHGLVLTFNTEQQDRYRVFEDADEIRKLGEELLRYAETDGYFW